MSKTIKDAIFSFVPVRDTSMIASVRIARYVADKTGYPVYWQDEIADMKLDLLIIINGAYGFSKHLPALAAAVLKARRIVWVQNDYTIEPPKITSNGVSPFRAAFRKRHEAGLPHMDFWTTCEDWAKFTPESLYVNWNALTFDQNYDPKIINSRRKAANDDLLYYGSFRSDGNMGKEGYRTGKKGREKYFDRYFKWPEVNTTISSPSKAFREKYEVMGSKKITYADAIKEDFFGTIGRYGLGLYIEDRMSHERFHSPANRFYEMLSAGLPIVFQPECGTMMRRAGFNPEPYYVHKAKDIKRFMDNREDVGKEQRKLWIDGKPEQFRARLDEQFFNAWQATQDALA